MAKKEFCCKVIVIVLERWQKCVHQDGDFVEKRIWCTVVLSHVVFLLISLLCCKENVLATCGTVILHRQCICQLSFLFIDLMVSSSIISVFSLGVFPYFEFRTSKQIFIYLTSIPLCNSVSVITMELTSYTRK